MKGSLPGVCYASGACDRSGPVLGSAGCHTPRRQPCPKSRTGRERVVVSPAHGREERKALHVPPGFEIQLVASEPDIHKPLNLAFDDRGRLWVTDTVEYPYPAAAGTQPRDTVKILSDFQADGRAGKIETFADGLNIPIGLLPLPSAERRSSTISPNIYLMRDTDGDGRADIREVLYGVFGNRDTHGMTNAFTWGFDGWIYACHGYANDSKVQGSDHRPISMNSGNTYRMRPDGSHAEYFTHGQVNPFGLAFDPLGNLYSCDCHSRPVYQLLRGAWYPSFGKPDDGLGFGPEMVTHDHGSTGIGGISYYAADQFPEAYRGTTFIGNVVTNRINHDRIEWHGSSPKGIEQPDFVWSEDNWFRPVDIELGPDGALYVADFYNRIIGHYEVPLTHPGRDRERGRIWRIVYRGTDGKTPAPPPAIDRTRSSVDDLVADLGHPNLAVRITAANQLVDRGGEPPSPRSAQIMKPETPARQRVHGLWVLERLQRARRRDAAGLRRRPRPRAARPQPESAGRADRARAAVSELASSRLNDADPFVRRAAAEVLGRHPSLAQHPAAACAPPVDARRRYASDPRRPDGAARPVEDRRGLGQARDTRASPSATGATSPTSPPGSTSPAAAAFLLAQLKKHRRAAGCADSGSSITSRDTVRPTSMSELVALAWLGEAVCRPSGSSS